VCLFFIIKIRNFPGVCLPNRIFCCAYLFYLRCSVWKKESFYKSLCTLYLTFERENIRAVSPREPSCIYLLLHDAPFKEKHATVKDLDTTVPKVWNIKVDNSRCFFLSKRNSLHFYSFSTKHHLGGTRRFINYWTTLCLISKTKKSIILPGFSVWEEHCFVFF
jgi:hypothetical protein